MQGPRQIEKIDKASNNQVSFKKLYIFLNIFTFNKHTHTRFDQRFPQCVSSTHTERTLQLLAVLCFFSLHTKWNHNNTIENFYPNCVLSSTAFWPHSPVHRFLSWVHGHERSIFTSGLHILLPLSSKQTRPGNVHCNILFTDIEYFHHALIQVQCSCWQRIP